MQKVQRVDYVYCCLSLNRMKYRNKKYFKCPLFTEGKIRDIVCPLCCEHFRSDNYEFSEEDIKLRDGRK